MKLYIEQGISATAYVVTGALAMITAEVPIRNNEDIPVEFSVYDQIIAPDGSIVTTTESRYRLGPGACETVLDELLRVKDPVQALEGYRLRVLLVPEGEDVCDQKEVEIAKV